MVYEVPTESSESSEEEVVYVQRNKPKPKKPKPKKQPRVLFHKLQFQRVVMEIYLGQRYRSCHAGGDRGGDGAAVRGLLPVQHIHAKRVTLFPKDLYM